MTILHKQRKNILVTTLLMILCSVTAVGLGIKTSSAAATTASSSTPCVASTAPTQWKHVVVLMFENKTYSQVVGSSSAPYISSLATKCGTYATWKDANYKVTGVTDGNYVSKPNYATLTSGVSPTTHGLLDDTYSTTTGVDNIYNQLRTASKNGKDYYSGTASATPCAGSNFSGAYHDAIRYFTNLGSTYCNSHDVPLSTFMTDVNAGTLPEFSMILPTNSENMHDNTIASGDTWAQNFLGPLFDSAQYKSGDTAVFFLWDEDTPIPNVLIAPSVVPGSKVTTPTGNPISHFSATRTWLEMLGLPLIGDSGQAPSLLSFFNGGGTPPPPTTDNPPAVNITAPSSGATLTASPTTLTANATDDIGVTKVEFYDGTTLLATDTTAPYSYSWDISTLSGSHSLTAKAYDTGGHITTSSAVSVTVSITPTSTCTNTPTNTLGSASIVVNTPAAGTYHVWSRIMAPDSTNNSYYIQIDSGCPIVVGDSTSIAPTTWTWLDYQDGATTTHTVTPNLTAGSHTITMIGKESGVRIDRILLLSNTCVPTGTGENCADTTAPSVSVTSPTAGATLVGTVTINVSASDNSGGSGIAKIEYLVDGSVVSSSTTATSAYQYAWNTSTVSDGSHTISARATDVAGNVTTSSAIAITVKNADATPPTAPSNLVSTSNSYNQVGLQWSASTDNVAVTGYRVVRSGVTVATLSASTLSYNDTSVTANTSYSYTIVAFDAANNLSSPSNALSIITPLAPDTTAPSAPTTLTGSAKSATQISLSWGVSTDNVGVTNYYVKRGGIVVGSTSSSTTSYSDTTVLPSSTYTYTIVATDAAGNISADSNAITVTTPALADTQAPTIPAGLTAALSGSQVNLNWTASSDNVATAGYKIFRNNVQIATSATTSFGDASVQTGQTYTYYVTAYDAAGNTSAASNQVTINVPTPPTSQTLTIKPTDDAWIKQKFPSTNYGKASLWRVDTTPLQDGIMKFTVSGINGRVVTSAKLTLYCTDGSPSGGVLHATTNTWTGSTVTWSNAPAAGASLATLAAVSKSTFYTIDLSNYITADGIYSLRINTQSGDGAAFATNENSTVSTRPTLTVTVQ